MTYIPHLYVLSQIARAHHFYKNKRQMHLLNMIFIPFLQDFYNYSCLRNKAKNEIFFSELHKIVNLKSFCLHTFKTRLKNDILHGLLRLHF